MSAVIPNFDGFMATSLQLVLLLDLQISSAVLSPKQGADDCDSLKPLFHQKDFTTFKRSSSSNLSWLAPYAPTAPVKIKISLAASESVLNLTNVHFAAPRISCDASTYGWGLNVASCQEAWELLPISTTRRTVRQRTEDRGKFRYSSSLQGSQP